jgi:hypothetical protein
MTGAEIRLSVWGQLPDRHRNEVCRQVRSRCEAYISSVRIDLSRRKAEIDQLVSEVVAHLLRATSLRRDEAPMDRDLSAMGGNESSPRTAMPWAEEGALDERVPARDARVTWLVEDTCNRVALFHRYEDMRRRDRGGKWDGSGYPLVAVDDQTMERLAGQYDPAEDEAGALHIEDSRNVWDGLVHLVIHHFGPNDDVVALVQVLAEDEETQESFGGQWPIGKIVHALNVRQPRAAWNDDRVDNAKRRLTKCIARLKQDQGLDAVDLRALLARYARERILAAGRSRRTV